MPDSLSLTELASHQPSFPLELDLAVPNHIGIGVALGAARAARGWSQERLATEAGSTQQVVSGIERGQTDFKASTLQRLFATLGTEVTLSVSMPASTATHDPNQSRERT